VQDLACGKGGDLPKWKEAGIAAYCGVDIATESVRTDGRLRYNTGRHAFPAALFVADCFEAPLAPALLPRGPFDVISCQFALHYAWGTEARARRALENVSSLLRAGGVFLGTTADANVLVRKLRAAPGLRFGNELYGVEFAARHADKAFHGSAPFGLEYRFTLADAVDGVAEYLVHRPTLEALAAQYGLRLVLWHNFHDFVASRLQVAEDRALWVARGLGGVLDDATGVATPARCALSAEEWEVAHLYAVFAFRKQGQLGEAESQLSARRMPARGEPGPWLWNLDKSHVKGIDHATGQEVELP
jgi:mRNA (guanine-N7-)-methyltransferase